MRLGEQAIRYGAVGAWNTVFGFVVFAVLLWLLGDAKYNLALGLTWTVAVVHNFLTYRLLVFRPEGQVLRSFARFVAVTAITIAGNFLGLFVSCGVFGLPVLPSQVAVLVFLVALSFVAHRSLTFGVGHRQPV